MKKGLLFAILLIAICQMGCVNKEKKLEDTNIFTVVYRQPVNGYQVKAVVSIDEYEINGADIIFEKEGESFMLHTTSFGDSTFNKGGWGMDGTNYELMEKYKGLTIETDYHENREVDVLMSGFTPFFFRDLDFDGVEELLIVHFTMAERYHSGFDVYRIVEGKPVLIDYPPYYSGCYDDMGMTDYPEFDYKKKTIECPYPEGELKWIGRIIYGVSKTEKDTVVVNGREYLFNHLEQIDHIKYDEEN